MPSARLPLRVVSPLLFLLAHALLAKNAPALSLAQGDLLVADASASGGAVIRVDPSTGDQTLVVGNLGALRGIAITATGRIFVAAASSVMELDAVAQTATVLNDQGFTDLQGIAVDAAGLVYVVDDLDDPVDAALVRLDPANPLALSVLHSGGLFMRDPTDLVLDAAGDAYVTENGSAAPMSVLRIPTAGAASVVTTNLELFNPLGITVDANGQLVVADTGSPALVDVAANGTQTVITSDNLMLFPVGVASGSGLYVADQSAFGGQGGVIHVDGAGNQTAVTWGDLLSGSGIVDLDVVPVPEPAIGLLLGLAIALVVRRR